MSRMTKHPVEGFHDAVEKLESEGKSRLSLPRVYRSDLSGPSIIPVNAVVWEFVCPFVCAPFLWWGIDK